MGCFTLAATVAFWAMYWLGTACEFFISSRFLQVMSVHQVFLIGKFGFMLPSAMANFSVSRTPLKTFL